MSSTDQTAQSDRKRGSGVRMVYDLLRDQILDLELPPGAIVDENQLAERFGMSRTPIREALVRLAAEGLIDTLPNRSTMVSQIDFPNLHTFFDALTLMYRVTTRLAAEHHQPDDLLRIRAFQASYEAAVKAGDEPGLVAANRDFHYAIAEAGRNRYYLALFGRLLDEGRRILRLYYYGSGTGIYPQIWFDEHEEIVRAVESRDLARADKIARQHANQIVSQIQAAITRDRRQDFEL